MWRTCCGRTHPNLDPVLWRAGKSFVRLVGKLDTEASETGFSQVWPRTGRCKRSIEEIGTYQALIYFSRRC